MSTPSSRASARTDGAAGTVWPISGGAEGAVVGKSRTAGSGSAGAAAGAASGSDSGSDGGSGSASGCAGSSAAALSSTTIAWPTLTVSPAATCTSFTRPSTGAGTSRLAFSVSTSINGWSRRMLSPTETSTAETSAVSMFSPSSGRTTRLVIVVRSPSGSACRGRS
jgi:hypothetical protein